MTKRFNPKPLANCTWCGMEIYSREHERDLDKCIYWDFGSKYKYPYHLRCYINSENSGSSEDIINKIREAQEVTGKNKYEKAGAEIGRLVQEKQAAYGDSYGNADKILKVLYPGGVRPDQYCDMLGVIRCIDKLFRVANSKNAFGENPWKDIAGYGLLGCVKQDKEDTVK